MIAGGKGVCDWCGGKGYDENADLEWDRQPILLYLGDHDPSGEDMVRDVRERLEMFGVHGIEVKKLALTMTQVQEYNPPPNPAKVTDPRAKEYVALHGRQSWEVDALPPQVLAQIIRDAFEGIVDLDKMKAVMEREKQDKERLRKAVKTVRKGA